MRIFARALPILSGLLAAVPAAADWRDDLGKLRVGVVSEAGEDYTRFRLEQFRTFIEARIELPVQLVAHRNLAALIRAQSSGAIDYAIHTALSYVSTEERCACVEPVAAPLALDGSKGFHALLLVRAGSSADDAGDLDEGRIAVTAPDSVAGYLAPLQALAAEGAISAEDTGRIVSAADPEDAITMLFTGEAEAAIGWSSLSGVEADGYSFGVLARMVATEALAMDEVRIVWRSPLIPFGPHAVRTDLPTELKLLLLDALTSLALEAPGILDSVDRASFGGGGFAAATAEDYQYLRELIAVGN